MSVANLNKARKARAKAEAKARADANEVKFGRSKAAKSVEDASAARAKSKIDDHKRER